MENGHSGTCPGNGGMGRGPFSYQGGGLQNLG